MVEIKQKRAARDNYGSSRTLSKIKYIVIHATGNDGDTDESNGRYFVNNVTKTSAHYFVDSDSITQSVPDGYIAYSVGGKKWNNAGGTLHKVVTNSNSISIELCDDKKNGVVYPSAKTIENALELTRMLMNKYNIPIDHVIRHYDVNGKPCPVYWCNDTKKNNLWITEFKNKLGTIPTPTTTPTASTYNIRVTADSLNVRSTASTSGKIVAKISKGSIQMIDKESNGWGHLANNAGWISLKYTEKI